ncbi:hypothetical protein HMI54_014003, partial [Coelomomyces lativittatus]
MLLTKSIQNRSYLVLRCQSIFSSWSSQRSLQILTPVAPVQLYNIQDNFGSRKPRKRLGRGQGSGHGGFCGKGHGGQNKRSGNEKPYPGFEGGQTPFIKRLPKFHGPDV